MSIRVTLPSNLNTALSFSAAFEAKGAEPLLKTATDNSAMNSNKIFMMISFSTALFVGPIAELTIHSQHVCPVKWSVFRLYFGESEG